MSKRRLVRIFAAIPLLLCITLWIGSYWYFAGIGYVHKPTSFSFAISSGGLFFRWSEDTRGISGFHYIAYKQGSVGGIVIASDITRYAGLVWQSSSTRTGSSLLIGTNLWLPTLLSLLFFLYLWRRTRKTIFKSNSFPIESQPSA